jgi:hypothetical protein
MRRYLASKVIKPLLIGRASSKPSAGAGFGGLESEVAHRQGSQKERPMPRQAAMQSPTVIALGRSSR